MIPAFAANWLASKAFKIIGVASTIGVIVTGFMLVTTKIELHIVRSDRNALYKRINDPVNGLVVQLAQSETNTATLKLAAERTIAVLREKAASDALTLADTQSKLAAAQQTSVRAREQSAIILSSKPKGDTLDAQIRDVDARLLETLK